MLFGVPLGFITGYLWRDRISRARHAKVQAAWENQRSPMHEDPSARRAREAAGENSPPEKRIGQNGKQQAARKRRPSPKRDKVREAVEEKVRNGEPVRGKEIDKL